MTETKEEPDIPSVPGYLRVKRPGQGWTYVLAEKALAYLAAAGIPKAEQPRVENVLRCVACGGWSAGGDHALQHFTGPDGLTPCGVGIEP